MTRTNDRTGLTKPLTLAIDIGGSHLKAAVLNASGKKEKFLRGCP